MRREEGDGLCEEVLTLLTRCLKPLGVENLRQHPTLQWSREKRPTWHPGVHDPGEGEGSAYGAKSSNNEE